MRPVTRCQNAHFLQWVVWGRGWCYSTSYLADGSSAWASCSRSTRKPTNHTCRVLQYFNHVMKTFIFSLFLGWIKPKYIAKILNTGMESVVGMHLGGENSVPDPVSSACTARVSDFSATGNRTNRVRLSTAAAGGRDGKLRRVLVGRLRLMLAHTRRGFKSDTCHRCCGAGAALL